METKEKLGKDWLVLDVSEWPAAKQDRDALATYMRLLCAMQMDYTSPPIRFANFDLLKEL